MILIEYLALFLVGYFFFKLISGVVLPVMRTVRVVRREFNQQQQGPMGPGTAPRYGNNAGPAQTDDKKAPNWDKMGDYIDFEEVK
jgi:hypothetical protein